MPPEPPPKTTSTTGQPSWMAPVMPVVPDHELVRRIGGGSYGDVWLARTTVGTWRAVKVVFRDRFTDARPYEREFNGIQKFEPLSRGNEAFIDILQIGRNDAVGYFYYVMELADDASLDAGFQIPDTGHAAQEITAGRPGIRHQTSSIQHPETSIQYPETSIQYPETYIPKTLAKVLLQRGRLPVSECLELGLTLNLGLAHLHRAGLIHRDIKPSNIIFVGSVPKLADIGLVIELAEARSFVGTEGFIPPEGPNSPQADLYSLGKVLYEAGMGKDRKDFPEPYTQIAAAPDAAALLEFNAILLKACAANRDERYQSAEEMNADLALLQSGGSVRRQRKLAGQLRFVQRAGAIVTTLAALIALGWWWQTKQTLAVRDLAEKNLTLARQAEDNAMRATKNELAARESLYAADIQLAQRALQADNLRLARSLLQNHVPPSGQPDLRGFEWRYLWQKCRSQELVSLQGHTNTCYVFGLAPDGQHVVVCDRNRVTKILNLRLQHEVATLESTNEVLSVSFSPAGDLFATGSTNEVWVWDARAFARLSRLPDAAAPVLFSPDGKFLLTGKPLSAAQSSSPQTAEQTLRIWNAADWTFVHETYFPASGPRSIARDLYLQLAFGTDPRRLAVLVGDTIRVLSSPELKELRVLPDKLQIGRVARPFLALSPDNRTLAFPGKKRHAIQLWDLDTHQELRVLAGHADIVIDGAFSPDGGMLATCSPDQTVKLWDVNTGELLSTFQGHGDEVFDVAFFADGKRLASLGAYDAVVKVWDTHTRTRSETIRKPHDQDLGAVPVGFDPGGGLITFTWPGMKPVVLDPATLECSATQVPICREGVRYSPHLQSVSPCGRFQGVRLENENVLEIWDRMAGRRLCSIPSLGTQISYDSQRQLVATITTNSAGRYGNTIWQLPAGTPKWTLTNEASFIRVFAAKDHLLTYANSQFQLWRITGEDLTPFAALPRLGMCTDAVVSPDGRLLAVISTGDIVVRALPSGTVIAVLKGHTRKGPLLAFSPDGQTLASIADDRTVRLWHIATQRELLQFQAPSEDQGAFDLEFSPDGRALVTTRFDEEGQVAWLHYAPSFAEIAVVEGGDYRSLAGEDPATWLNVAKALQRENRRVQALEACDEVLRRTANREELTWLADKARPLRVSVLKQLNRLDEAGIGNCANLGIAPRNPAAPPGTIDLSAFYNRTLADAAEPNVYANDLSELPQGLQTFAGTVFDVRGRLQVIGGAAQRQWSLEVERIEGIRVGRRLARLHFLHAAHGDSRKVAAGDRLGHYRLHFADGRTVEIPIRYNVDLSDYWALEHLPSELPEAVEAWRGDNPHSRATGNGDAIRLFKRTWQNPFPEVEVTTLDFVAENAGTHPWLIALTAE